MLLLLGAFIAGILTVLAPCVLPLLPIIIGGSVSGDTSDKRRPLIITGSLAVSLIIFTLLLKVSTALINIPPAAITDFSGGIIVALGLVILFPKWYATMMTRSGFEAWAQRWLGAGTKNRRQVVGPILTGAALGPVFSSCSPVYAYIVATILPAHAGVAMAYIVAYVIGLALVLLVIGYYGQRFSSRLAFMSRPNGIFQRGLAAVFIAVGILVISGGVTKLQVYAANHSFLNIDKLTAALLPKSNHAISSSKLYNVAPYQEPELAGIQGWINSSPLTLAQLKGKVVLVDFWTYSCINCIRTLPYVEGWYQNYQADGLVVLGISAPEFSFEKVQANVAKAVVSDKLTYPIALDNNLDTWNAFQNQYWPADYLIDRSGNVRREDFGEGSYAETEQAIRGLLASGLPSGQSLPAKLVAATDGPAPVSNDQTPETYLGTDREDAYVGQPDLGTQTTQTYSFASQLSQDEWSLSGTWTVVGDQITAAGNSKLSLNFAAKNVYLVGGSNAAASVGVTFNGRPLASPGSDVANAQLSMNGSRLYNLASFPSFTAGTLELTVPSGVSINTFTFGN